VNARRKQLVPATVLALGLLMPAGVAAQIITGPRTPPETPPEPRRPILLQIGAGPTVPLAHLAATGNQDDGYALPSANVIFRAWIPFKGPWDVMVDLTLPRFKFGTTAYLNDNLIPLQDAKWEGKLISLGGRWRGWRVGRGEAYLMASGGMYQLNLSRFEYGVLVERAGAFRPGAALGAGVNLPLRDFELDAGFRYHRFTDTGHYGLGDLSWLEFAVLFSIRVTG
jgi:hypothetical protein